VDGRDVRSPDRGAPVVFNGEIKVTFEEPVQVQSACGYGSSGRVRIEWPVATDNGPVIYTLYRATAATPPLSYFESPNNPPYDRCSAPLGNGKLDGGPPAPAPEAGATAEAPAPMSSKGGCQMAALGGVHAASLSVVGGLLGLGCLAGWCRRRTRAVRGQRRHGERRDRERCGPRTCLEPVSCGLSPGAQGC
jgi:hypothetical protein